MNTRQRNQFLNRSMQLGRNTKPQTANVAGIKSLGIEISYRDPTGARQDDFNDSLYMSK